MRIGDQRAGCQRLRVSSVDLAVSVDVENDVVVFRVGSNLARFSYTTAFMIAQQLRLFSGLAARIAGATLDSRRVTPGDLFFALRGYKTDGERFVPQAIERGASAVAGPLTVTRR